MGRVIVSPVVWSDRGREAFALEGASVAEILRELGGVRELPLAALDFVEVQTGRGELVPREAWEDYRPAPGVELLILVRPAGGGFKKIAGLLAAVVVAVVAWWAAPILAPALAGATGLSLSTATAVAQGALTAVGSMLVGSMFKPPAIEAQTQTGPGFMLAGQSNESRPYGVIPRILGRRRVAPALVGVPRSVIRGGVQYLQALYVAGYAPLALEDLRSGNTPLGSIRGARAVVHESFSAGDPLELYFADTSVSAVGVELKFGEEVRSATGAESLEAVIGFAWASGLINYNPKTGGERNAAARLWINATNLETSETLPLSALSPRLDLGAEFIGGGWLEASGVEVFARTAKLIQAAITIRFPQAGRWEISVTQTDARREDGTQYDKATFATLQGLADRSPIAPASAVTVIELEVPASEQAQNTLQLFTAVATSKLPRWDGAGLTAPEPTRNPAWCYLEILRGGANPRALPLSRIDLAALSAWAAWCDAPAQDGLPRYCCDLAIESETTVWDALRLVVGCGRAAPTIREGLHSVLMDEAERVPVQVFTELNARNISASRAYLDPPHALRVRFVDPESDWQPRELVVYDDGQTAETATKFETLELAGITRAGQAWRDGRYYFAEAKLRRERVTLEVDIENLAARRGDLVYLAHDVLEVGGAPFFVLEVLAPDRLRISAGLETSSPAGLGVRVRHPGTGANGANVGPVLSILAIDRDAGEIQTAAPHGAEVGDLCVIGAIGREVGSYLVEAVAAAPDLAATLSLVELAPAIYSADTGSIPPYVPEVGGRPSSDPVGPVRALSARVSEFYENRRPYAEIVLDWIAPSTPGVRRYDVSIWRAGAWVGLDSREVPGYVFGPVDRLSLIEPTTFRFRVVAIAGDGSRSAQECAAVVNPDTQAPEAPASISAAWRSPSVFASWPASISPDVRIYRAQLLSSSDAVLQTREAFALEALFEPVAAGAYTVRVQTVDSAGNASAWKGAPVTVPRPPAVASASVEIRPRDVLLSWPRVDSPEVVGAEVLLRAPGGAVARFFAAGVAHSMPPQLAGRYQAEIRSRNAFGDLAEVPAVVAFEILAPRRTRISGNSVANTAFLRWGSLSGAPAGEWEAQTSHQLAFYELKRERVAARSRELARAYRGAMPADAGIQWVRDRMPRPLSVLGSDTGERYAGEFAYVDEAAPGRWRYSVRAIDLAGNAAPWEWIVLTLEAPDNYELLDEADNVLPLAEVRESVFSIGEDWLAPVDLAATWGEHFSREGWESIADQLGAGFPVYAQPAADLGRFVWSHDFLKPLPRLKIHFGPEARQVEAAPIAELELGLEVQIEDSQIWVSVGIFPDSIDYLLPFGVRAVRVEFRVKSGAARAALAMVRRLAYRLEVRHMLEDGVIEVAAEGSSVDFVEAFNDVRSVQLTIVGGPEDHAFFARYRIADNQRSMMIYCLDRLGEPVPGRVSYMVRGV